MDKFFKYALLFFALSILLSYGYVLYIAPSPVSIKKDRFTNHKDVLKDVNNGDLIFLSGDTHGERLCRWFSGCIFSHVGLMFVDDIDGEIYVLDSDLGQNMKDGVRIQKLTDKLRKYKGMKIGAIKRVKINSSIPSSKFLELIEKYKNVDFDDKMLTWFFGDISFMRNLFENKKKMFCSEFVAECLEKLGILSESSKKPSYYGPGDFYRTFKTKQDYTYEKPEFFRF